jgi:hypothetical protein
VADRHPDRREVLRAMLLGAAGLAVPAACGLPTGGHAIIDGPAKIGQPGSADNPQKAPTPDGMSNPKALVSAFFGAVAGRVNSTDEMAAANERALKFLTTTASGLWPQQGNGYITVVRLDPDMTVAEAANGTLVEVSVKPTGLIQPGAKGVVAPPNDARPRKLQFTVVDTGAPGQVRLRINQIETLDGDLPLTGMMLDSNQLDGVLFTAQLLYFWSVDHSGLVPDLRYVAKAGVGREIQYTDIVNWMLQGPSPFIQDAVLPNTYSGISLALPNLAAPDNDGLLVNLTLQPPQSLSLDQVMAQLRWSLQPLYDGTVRLQVASQRQNVDGSTVNLRLRQWNLADKQDRDDTEYCVVGGVVRPVDDLANTSPAILDNEANKGVAFAALSRDLKAAALVKTDGLLHVGDSQSADFIVAQQSGRPLSGQPASWTRPVYLPSSSHRVLIGLNGLLYLVGADGAAERLQTPDSIQEVSAFSLAPDGRRIAVISGGLPYVCSLIVNGRANNEISFGSLQRQLDVGLTGCTAIAWLRLDRVLVAGRVGQGSTFQMVVSTIDGAVLKDFGPPFTSEIRSVVASPPTAWDTISGTDVALMQTASGESGRRVYSGNSGLLALPTQPSPSPSASGPAQAPGIPTYPFYLG